ncbi:hypothetical protein ACSRUE_31485 [Sorangium sp. KYC3313]|uniref:hypothetical protein n=1 Tax=Sorangium sp. KYC3313 TaxID=3449740 RepID=UPI003F8AAA3A
MARRIWNRLSDPALHDELVKATRALIDHTLPWVSVDTRFPCVRLSDAAEELLFLIGKQVPGAEEVK